MNRYGTWVSLAGAILALALCAAAGVFLHWKNGRLETLESGSTLSLLPQGVIEYADRGEGPVALVVHGSPGGYDQGLVLGAELKRRGFRIIAVSRPGYLRTPLKTGPLVEDQADALDALLDALGVDRCAVLAVTEGTPCAVQLAKRHPGRVSALALLSPVTPDIKHTPIATTGYKVFHDLTGDLGCWWFMMHLGINPGAVFGEIAGLGSSLKPSRCRALAGEVLGDPAQRDYLGGLLRSITPLTCREAGIINDNAQLMDIPLITPGEVTTPLLAVVGEEATQTPLASVQKFLSLIPKARLLILPRTGMILPIGREYDRLWDGIAAFLKAPPAEGP